MQNKGVSFDHVFNRVMQDRESKVDYFTPVNNLTALEDGSITFKRRDLVAKGAGDKDVRLTTTSYADGQMLGKLGMPAAYFRKAKDADPALFAQHFNFWAQRHKGDALLRTRDHGNGIASIRGIVSGAYSVLDNHEIMQMLSRILDGSGADYRIEGYTLDDHRFHMRITFPDLTKALGNLPNGTPDYNRVGMDLNNSEVGFSSFNLQAMIYRLICSNGLWGWGSDGEVFRQRHAHLRRPEIQARAAEAMVTAARTGAEFLSEFEATQDQRIDNPFNAIKAIARENNLSGTLTDTVLDNFEGDKNAYSVTNAFTRAARVLPNERRIEVERLAGRLVRFTPTRWEKLSAIDVGEGAV